MTRDTTAMLFIGPRSIAPWGDRKWRVSIWAQLVEGSEPPYWSVAKPVPVEHSVASNIVKVDLPCDEDIVSSIVMLVATHLGGDDVTGWLIDTHNLTMDGETRVITPYWELAPDVLDALSSRLSGSVRLGLTTVCESSLVTPGVIAQLRALGFDVDVFGLLSSHVVR
jgi:hypothetical protein